MYDTIIIGAGAVGSYLARKLAQLGYKVLVLEKKASAGQDVCCTGIVSKECLNLLQLDSNLTFRQVSSAKFFAPSGKPLKLWRNHKVAYIIDRPSLNLALADRAQESSVCYLFGAQVTDIQAGVENLQVSVNYRGQRRLFEADTAVIATGFGSSLPCGLGLGEIKHFVIGAQAEVNMTNPDEVEIYFDQRLTPGGFAWLVPTSENKGLAGLLTYQQPEQHLNKFLSCLKTQGSITSTEVIPSYGAIPLRPLPRTYTDRILVVGEAAGQVKPTTGGGIYYGLLCADIAADTLHRAFRAHDFSGSRLAAYQKEWQARVGKELRIGYWTHRLFQKLDNRKIEWLHNFINKSGIPQFIAELDDFSFDWHSEIILKTLKHLAFASPTRAIKTLREINATTN
ncbi:MAG: NAD(P)/FAD-dependent oxidoreductase [Dehalococcoidia bacterium]|nr:NAD(P)/FAD-dependent oxidoreductase [Dehalococcoidia bacterium]